MFVDWIAAEMSHDSQKGLNDVQILVCIFAILYFNYKYNAI